MAHPNEYAFLSKFLSQWPLGAPDQLPGRVLNCGAVPVKGAIDYRPLFPDRELIGTDMQPGPGIDVVADLTDEDSMMKAYGRELFAAILCCSVLEHVEKPWYAAINIQNFLMPGGLLYITVPWTWRYHGYPKDYWRMSPDAIRVIFPKIQWKRTALLTQAPDEEVPNGRHDDPPWRFAKGSRAYVTTSMTCMIGRLAVSSEGAAS